MPTIEERMFGKSKGCHILNDKYQFDKIEKRIATTDAISIAKEYAEEQRRFTFGKLMNCITKRFGFHNASLIANDYHGTTPLATEEE